MKKLLPVLISFALLPGAFAQAPGESTAPKKLIVVTATKGFRHSSIPTAENVLATLAERSGAFTIVDFVRGGGDEKKGADDTDVKEKLTIEKLRGVDGVIFANTTGELAIPDKENFVKWIEAGHAFIGMHSCSDTFHEFPAFVEMLGGEFLTHGAQVQVDCFNLDPAHPACRPLGPIYTLYDEIYLFKSFTRERVHGLLTLDKHPNSLAPGDFPVAWCRKAGLGRVFYTSLGHREDVWTSQRFQQHIFGGIVYALGLEPGEDRPQDNAAPLSEVERRDGYKLLFDGKTLNGWKLRREDGKKSWSAQRGMLVNTLGQGEHGTDLVSEEKFRDFVVRYEFQVPPGSNSGFYLRGRHEIQIFDDYGKAPAPGGNGAIYNVKAVTLPASRKAGEWQHAEARIVGQKISFVLNGVKVHDNVDCPKGTGSQLDDNVDQPGPILLQGDHGAVAFRNMRIKRLN